MNPCRRGFTLVELMIVIAIIGILAAIAIPMISQMIAKSQEGTTKGNLGALRSAISVYYGDNEGVYPMDTLYGSLTSGSRYMEGIPDAQLPVTSNSAGHGVVTGIKNPPITDVVGHINGWVYDNSGPGIDTWGQVYVNCTHQDVKGNVWSSD